MDILFLESPSQIASSSEWKTWRERLNNFNPRNHSVVEEKARAERIIKLLLEEEELDRQAVMTQEATNASIY